MAGSMIDFPATPPVQEAGTVFVDILRKKPLRKKYAAQVVLSFAAWGAGQLPDDPPAPIGVAGVRGVSADECENGAKEIEAAMAMHAGDAGVVGNKLTDALKKWLPYILQFLPLLIG